MIVGPIFFREAAVTPRRRSFFVGRLLYPITLFFFMYTAWLLVAGTQNIRNIGDMARFGAILFNILAPLQLALLTFTAAIQASSSVAVEKDRKTLLLLLLTRLNNSELVLGRLLGSLLPSLVNLMLAVPVFMAIVLFGGTSFYQVLWVFAVTLISMLVGGSWGTLVGFWREKSFQILALTLMGIVSWIGIWEALGSLEWNVAGVSMQRIAAWFNPLRAVLAAVDPRVIDRYYLSVLPFLGVGLLAFLVLNIASILGVRVWNPSREIRSQSRKDEAAGSIWGAEYDLEQEAEKNRQGHVDARVRQVSKDSRKVWNNPILWREMCTWAYGRKILMIRAVYWMIALLVFAASFYLIQTDAALSASGSASTYLPAITKVVAPFLFISLMIVNSLGVTSITNERDGRSLDLLLVTDLSPAEFLLGKLGGVLFITLDSILLPILLCTVMWWFELLSSENFFFLTIGLLTLNLFVAMLGLHCGRSYPTSRPAILASLGTLFFLFLGTVTCMLLLVSFAGNVDSQLASFLAFIVGGGIGLFWILGAHNPSPALFTASILMPMGMFYSLTSLLLKQYLGVFLVVFAIFAFAIAAMTIPALSEFSFSSVSPKSDTDD